MKSIQYVGEHLWIHYTGHFLVCLAFISALFALTAFILNRKQFSDSWKKVLHWLFLIHLTSIFSIIGLIFFMMSQHYYEYNYVWAHVSDELPTKYILSAFWEGQEGSFLLWMFWNCVLGLFFFRFRSRFDHSILSIILAVNLILSSMLLGIYVGESRIGSSPFALLRHMMDIPLFNNAEYTQLIKGNGLNPLLQNYWMIIHPPTLFLGFASTIIPFAYALSGIMEKDFSNWLKPVLPWALFSGFILGTGILMGGAWAYEALSFGGYWAWDPVENMSLVPWIVLIAGIHTNLVAKSTGFSVGATMSLYFLSFILVVYSSFLTRSGILGDSSAHAFTQMGLEWQLVFFCVVVSSIPLAYFISRYKLIPQKEQEEQFHSREFWMFIGSLVLLFSALLISFTTSIPVYNKILDQFGKLFNYSMESWHRSPPLEPIKHHNQYQLWIGVLVALLSSISVYLRYLGERTLKLGKSFLVSVSISLLISIGLSWISYYSFEKLHWSHLLLLGSAWFAICSSALYLIRSIRFNPLQSALVCSHGGFGILLLGILFTGINKRIISTNEFAQRDLLENWSEDDISKHLTLIKDQKMFMNGYWVNYSSDTFINKSRIYELDFWKEDSLNNKTEQFKLYPEVQYDNKLTKVAAANPSTKHYLNRDVFSLIAQIPQTQTDVEAAKKAEDSLKYELYFCKLKDTIYTKNHFIILDSILTDFAAKDFEFKSGDQKLQFKLKVKNLEEKEAKTASPGILFRQNLVYKFPYQLDAYRVRIQIPDTIYDLVNPKWENIPFEHLLIKKGQQVELGQGKFLKLNTISRDIDPEIYVPKEDEIAVAAEIEFTNGSQIVLLKPIYLIRGNQIISLPVSAISPGITLRFSKINPQTEEMGFDYFVHSDLSKLQLPILVAENAVRNDFIVIQVIEFPWINLVWFGSILMLSGLLLASYTKIKNKRDAS